MNEILVLLLTGLAIAVTGCFLVYRLLMRQRVRDVHERVRDYLRQQYDAPVEVHINCSDDPLWPILVSFVDPHGARQDLQFMCAGPISTFALVKSEN